MGLLQRIWRLLDHRLRRSAGRDRPLPGHPHFPFTATPPETLALPTADASGRQYRLIGHLQGHYSLAIVNRALALALQQRHPGSVTLYHYHGQPAPPPDDLPQAQAAALRPLLRAHPLPGGSRHTIHLVGHYPLLAMERGPGLNLLLFFWEEGRVPAEMVAALQRDYHAVLVASRFVKKALRDSGCRLPICVIPLGVDHLIDPVAPLAPLPSTRPLRLLHLSSAFERKGVDLLLAAYHEAFTADHDVELYIKTFPNPHNRLPQQLAAARRGHRRPPRVMVDQQPLDDHALLALYRSCHALLLPTRGEGFNLPAAEALALGLPLLVTGHGGHSDFAAQDNARLIRYRLAPARSHLSTPDSHWIEPDRDHLVEQMRQLCQEIERGDPALERRRQRGRQTVAEAWRWDHAAQAIDRTIGWLHREQNSPRPPPRLALVAPAATADRLAAQLGSADVPCLHLLPPGEGGSGPPERLDEWLDRLERAPADLLLLYWRAVDRSRPA